jgi:phage N-6-adenine-methyltransferase
VTDLAQRARDGERTREQGQGEGEKVNTATLFSSQRDDWQTPPELFAQLDAEFGFTLDVAANRHNAQCPTYIGPDHDLENPGWLDALAIEWEGICWMNPPYSRGLQAKFIAKAAAERLRGVTTVMLLPARTDTRAFHAHIWDAEQHKPRPGVEVRFLKGRLKFVGAKAGAPFPSMIVVFRGR